MVRNFSQLAKHKGKALGLREGHMLQRHDDGSYTIKIRLVPEDADMNGDGIDGIIINRSRSVRAIDR